MSGEPQRIQLSRRRGWRKPDGAIVVSRPSKFGNPFRVGETWKEPDGTPHVIASKQDAVDEFESYLRAMLIRTPDFLAPLRGRNLCCWCKIGEACHADVLLRVANCSLKSTEI
nr:DUF4326 domain-containing protein [uncultured Rhodopila sp.]